MNQSLSAPIFNWQNKYGLPEFERIDEADFQSAFAVALHAHKEEIASIAGEPAPPEFANLVERLEIAGEALSRVSALFWVRAGANTSDVIRQVERDIAPVLSRHFSEIARNRELYARIEAVWDKRDILDKPQFRVLEKLRRGFIHAGAALAEDQQSRLAEISETLAVLCTRFGQNVQEDEESWILLLDDEKDLAGLPGFLCDAMAQAARDRGHEKGYAITLSRSIIAPFLSFSDRRELREKAFSAWISRGEGKRDNWGLIREILALRNEKAKLLGYDTYAAYKLEDTMARTAGAVDELLSKVWQKAVDKVHAEAEVLKARIADSGANHRLEPWDWRYYAEKERARKFSFSDSQVKPYFELDRMIEAAFEVATRLFKVRFEASPAIAAWHEDVRAFEVRDEEQQLVGMFFGDYFARPTKRSGAWMGGLQASHKLAGGRLPFIYNVMNFAKSGPGKPTLLSLDDARTLFHEFGHALHGLLSKVRYPSISGTSVARDFVELPSQLFEHWLMVPEILRKFAVHSETGEALPDELIERIRAAEKFNTGFHTTEFTASALVDMAYHTAGEISDPADFEAKTLERLGMPAEIVMRHRSPHFLHVFSGDGYSAGYYAYLWSEVLDADAFRAFEEAGDPFDSSVAERLYTHIYSAGGARDPAESYKAYRGRLPSPEAMLQGRGLD